MKSLLLILTLAILSGCTTLQDSGTNSTMIFDLHKSKDLIITFPAWVSEDDKNKQLNYESYSKAKDKCKSENFSLINLASNRHSSGRLNTISANIACKNISSDNNKAVALNHSSVAISKLNSEDLIITVAQPGIDRLPDCRGTVMSQWNNCFGSVIYSNGSKYIGDYKNGVRNGRGTYFYSKENIFKVDVNMYIGEWKNDKFNGYGTLIFDGYTYVGEFKDDKRDGQGIQYKSDGSIIASGNWSSNKLDDAVVFDGSRFPFNSSTQITAATNFLNTTERDRLNAVAEGERKKRQELEQQLESNKERDRITAELDAERRKRQELEAQFVVQQQPSQGLKRNAHALVIGNGAYTGSGRLDNPVNDANAISQKLRSMGFTVTTVTDANRQRLVQSLAQFRRSASAADLSLLFYAGHGVQIFGTNYILPTDVDQTDPAQATIQGVSLNSVVENFLPGKTKLVFLDACRDNPLQRTNDRSVSKGLAPISVAEGTLISYATKDGQTAADGVGSKNSPFTQALLEHLNDPQDIAVVLRKVRAKVMKATGGKQQPWEYGSLTGGELVLSTIRSSTRDLALPPSTAQTATPTQQTIADPLPSQANQNKSKGLSENYAARLIGRIKPNITFPGELSGNPRAEVEVRVSTDGTILSQRIVQSSGFKVWDDAVIRAVKRTAIVPKDIDGRVPPLILLGFRPLD